MIFNKKQTPAANEPAENEAENPFVEAANELIEMEQNGELPEGFDLQAAVQLRFASMPPKSAQTKRKTM